MHRLPSRGGKLAHIPANSKCIGDEEKAGAEQESRIVVGCSGRAVSRCPIFQEASRLGDTGFRSSALLSHVNRHVRGQPNENADTSVLKFCEDRSSGSPCLSTPRSQGNFSAVAQPPFVTLILDDPSPPDAPPRATARGQITGARFPRALIPHWRLWGGCAWARR